MESKILDVISERILKTASEEIIQNMQATCRMQDNISKQVFSIESSLKQSDFLAISLKSKFFNIQLKGKCF